MLRKILKWTGGIIATFIGALLIFYFVMHIYVNNKRAKTYNVEVRMLEIPSDSATIAEGAHIYATKGCGDCHGDNGAGKFFMQDKMIGAISGTNLTAGKGGRPADQGAREWLLALRHGLKRDYKPLLVMPSYEYYKMSDHDISSLVAYLESLPPVDHEVPPATLGPLGTVLSGLDKLPLIPADKIDHGFRSPAKVERTVSAEYGQYLSMSCTGCHSPSLKGGDSPIPGGTPVRDITTTGNIGKWSMPEFVTALRTGKTPDGRQLKNEDMPWKMTNQYTDGELEAIYLYLKTL
ncbi:c-type cytochrome [Chitinophaga alhagiae]|nr:c-type cytochrome [Chitinophaga alhagiae]